MKELTDGIVKMVTFILNDCYYLGNKKCDDLTLTQVQDLAAAIRRVRFATMNLQRMVNRIEDKYVADESGKWIENLDNK